MNNNFSEENVFFFESKNNSGDRSTNIQVPLSHSNGKGTAPQVPLRHSNGKGTAPQVPLRPSVGNGAANQVPLRPTVGNGAANQVPQRHPNGNGTAIRASQRHTIGNGEAMVCTPPGSDVDFNSTDESESFDPPLEGYTQLWISSFLFAGGSAEGKLVGRCGSGPTILRMVVPAATSWSIQGTRGCSTGSLRASGGYSTRLSGKRSPS